MLYGAQVAVCSETNTKHINTVQCGQNVNFRPVGARSH